jgi:hypothetical protein
MLDRAFGQFDLRQDGSLMPELMKHVVRAATDSVPTDEQIAEASDAK